MGRRAKNKQGVPPTFDEFQASKLKTTLKEKEMVLKNRKMIYRFLKPKSSTSSSKQTDRTESSKPKPKTKSKVTKDVEVEEEVENLPEVDLEELASAKKSLLMIQKRKSWTMNLTSKVKKTLTQMKENVSDPCFQMTRMKIWKT